ncbi:MAG: CRP-like cAMP-binding protein [Candidatus Poriferisodalaceae bacterium]
MDIARLGAADFFGEIGLLTGAPRNATATATAVGATTVFSLGGPAFAAALKTDHTIGVSLLETMALRQQVSATFASIAAR